MPKWMWFAKAFCLVFLAGTVARAEPVKLSIPTLPVPSLGAFLGPIINSEGFDKANGLDITFMPKPIPIAPILPPERT